jgi:outer membrane protein assembly factor BamB
VRRLALLVLLLALAAPVAAHAAAPPLPIPSDPRDGLLRPATGGPVTARPLGRLFSPRHPFMAPNARSNIHDDAYQTDAYAGRGPLGPDLNVTSMLFVAECASVTFDRHGRIVTVCVSPTGATLRMLDPTTLATLASYNLPSRKLGSFSFSNFAGGGYFYLDQLDRAVVTTFTDHLLVLAEDGRHFRKVRDVDLAPATHGGKIISALPDWKGRIWFVTEDGVVGYVTPGGALRSRHLPAGEVIANSFAIDESGGVFVVSDHALYRFDARRGRPVQTWRKTYDRGSRTKPGQVSQGSGTTPTLIGSARSKGGGSIAITDNADPRMNVLVFRRGKAGPGRALCRQPVFAAGRSNDENSLISVPGGLIAENNYGYAGPLPTSGLLRTATTEPGLVRIDVDYRDGGCHVAWANDHVRVPTLVSKVSLATGLLYTYTHPAPDELPWQGPSLGPLAPDAWYLTAVDVRTGRQVWSRFAGSGLGWGNNYAPVTLGPDGSAYVGVLGGLVRFAEAG